MDNRPIGVFDSGMGGLTVWRELRKCMPHESLIYYGDGKHCPYGPKPQSEVVEYVDQAVRFLIDRDIKLLVVACNAATAAAIEYLRAHYSFPIVGMEPAVKPAALSTKTGVIGILATKGTLNGELYAKTSAKYSSKVTILSAVGEGFVELVESNKENTSEAVDAVSRVFMPMLAKGADRIVLGCTHYPFLSDVMKRVAAKEGKEIELIDPAPAVERRVAVLLDENNLRADRNNEPRYEFYSAAGEQYCQKLREKVRLISTSISTEK